MSIGIEDLGISKEDLLARVIDKIASDAMAQHVLQTDEDGEEFEDRIPTRMAQAVEERVVNKIDEAIDNIAAKHVLPNVAEYVETITLQQTNKWGERVGEPMTFIEYLVERAQAYLQEPVDYEGTPVDKRKAYRSSSVTQTRITHLVERHLHYSIEKAMKEAVKTANDAITGGIEQAVKIKLQEVSEGLKVTVKTK
jgi:hypothetical protein